VYFWIESKVVHKVYVWSQIAPFFQSISKVDSENYKSSATSNADLLLWHIHKIMFGEDRPYKYHEVSVFYIAGHLGHK
jgi:hypothetical protein